MQQTQKSALGLAVLIVLAATMAFAIATTGDSQNKTTFIRVACIGDSITRGTEYPNDLRHLLGPDYVIGNFGVGGATIQPTSGNGYVTTTTYENAKLFQPNIVVIMLGTNDANPTLNESETAFVTDYIKVGTAFESLGSKPRVLVVLPPPIFENNQSRSSDVLLRMVIPGVKEVAATLGLQVVDAYSPLLSHPDYFVDGIHPNAAGAQLIAEAVFAIITS